MYMCIVYVYAYICVFVYDWVNLLYSRYGHNIVNQLYFIYLFIFVFLSFLGPLPRHMEVRRLGVQSEP